MALHHSLSLASLLCVVAAVLVTSQTTDPLTNNSTLRLVHIVSLKNIGNFDNLLQLFMILCFIVDSFIVMETGLPSRHILQIPTRMSLPGLYPGASSLMRAKRDISSLDNTTDSDMANFSLKLTTLMRCSLEAQMWTGL